MIASARGAELQPHFGDCIDACGLGGDSIYQRGDSEMDKDRVVGAAKQAKGAIKEAAGKAFGDTKLTAEGKSDKVEGKIQNAVGGLKDALRK
jgi:uncharacterized protein YjbJ (UPF0337 family)